MAARKSVMRRVVRAVCAAAARKSDNGLRICPVWKAVPRQTRSLRKRRKECTETYTTEACVKATKYRAGIACRLRRSRAQGAESAFVLFGKQFRVRRGACANAERSVQGRTRLRRAQRRQSITREIVCRLRRSRAQDAEGADFSTGVYKDVHDREKPQARQWIARSPPFGKQFRVRRGACVNAERSVQGRTRLRRA